VLQKKGYQFKSTTDTEVLLALFDAYGEDCVQHLDGMFAFAIWDEKTQRCFMARDRFGEKPLYYFHDSRKLVFASEIKALWAFGIEKKVPEASVYNYLLFNFPKSSDAATATFYEGVSCLPSANFMWIDTHGKRSQVRYWTLHQNEWQKSKLSLEQAAEEFKQRLTDSIRLRMRSDVPVGSSLSGGLDSSAIVSLLLAKLKPKEFSTFSACFPGFEKDEEKYVDILQKEFKNQARFQKVYPKAEDLAENFNTIIHAQDEPFGSMSITAQYQVYCLARKTNVPVLLDGQGADEYLAGYRNFQVLYYYQLKASRSKQLKTELQAYQRLHQKAYPLADKEMLLRVSLPKAHQALSRLSRRIKATETDYFVGLNPQIVKRQKQKSKPIKDSPNLRTALANSLLINGLNTLLRYSDRNAMINSIEVRLPFLDHQLVEFVFSLPDHYLIFEAWSKYLLRLSMQDQLPKEIVWRKNKVGFATPQDSFMKSTFFTNKVHQAKNELKRKGLIHDSFDKMNWSYVMLNEYIT
jgi:asparagine synthase (glutamine-hydrolysing)